VAFRAVGKTHMLPDIHRAAGAAGGDKTVVQSNQTLSAALILCMSFEIPRVKFIGPHFLLIETLSSRSLAVSA